MGITGLPSAKAISCSERANANCTLKSMLMFAGEYSIVARESQRRE